MECETNRKGWGFIPETCLILGIPISPSRRGESRNGSPSVDRLDNTKCYTKDNIQVVSNLANSMKNCATPEQLILFAKWVLDKYEYKV